MEKDSKTDMGSPLDPLPPGQDESENENHGSMPTVMSMSPEYPKHRDGFIFGCAILFLCLIVGGVVYMANAQIKRPFHTIQSMVYYYRGTGYLHLGRYGRTISDYNRAIALNPTFAQATNDLAWLLATCPKGEYRNGKRAITLAKKAFKMAPGSHTLDTLAAAYAEAGAFEEAIRIQEMSIARLKREGQSGQLTAFIKRLNAYKARRAWREKFSMLE